MIGRLLLALLLGFATPALAQAPGAPSQERRDAARALVEEVLAPSFFAQFWPEFRNGFLRAFRRPPGMSEADAEQAVNEALLPMFREREADLQVALTELYAREFEAAELAELQRFYASPLGQRLLAANPRLAHGMAQAAQAWSQAILRDRLPDIREALRSKGMGL
jgi:hypothetical protein